MSDNYARNPGVKTPKPKNVKNKGSQNEMLPSRHARSQLLRSGQGMNDYTKRTPSGAGAMGFVMPGMFRGD